MMHLIRNGLKSGLIGLLVVVSMSASNTGYAAAITPSGSYVASFVTTDFSYDGLNLATSVSYLGSDNVGGKLLAGAGVDEYSATSSGACTASDGSTGTAYSLVGANAVSTYTAGQLYAVAATGSSICVNASFTAFNGSVTFEVTGGSRNFSKAAGSITENFSGVYLAAPTSPGFGFFGAAQYAITGGSVTR
jgi:hypothetical protein